MSGSAGPGAAACCRSIVSEIDRALSRIDETASDALCDMIRQAGSVFCAGSGRTGFMVRAFAMRLMHIGFTSHMVGDTVTPSIAAGDLLLIGSGSGETETLLVTARNARRAGARVALVTIFPDSSIGRQADLTVAIPATTAKVGKKAAGEVSSSLQPKGSLFEQSLLIYLDSLVVMLMHQSGFSPDRIMTRHENLE